MATRPNRHEQLLIKTFGPHLITSARSPRSPRSPKSPRTAGSSAAYPDPAYSRLLERLLKRMLARRQQGSSDSGTSTTSESSGLGSPTNAENARLRLVIQRFPGPRADPKIRIYREHDEDDDIMDTGQPHEGNTHFTAEPSSPIEDMTAGSAQTFDEDVARFLQMSLSSPPCMLHVLSLRKARARAMLRLLQSALDTPSQVCSICCVDANGVQYSSQRTRGRILRLLANLAKRSREHPPDAFVTGVIFAVRDPNKTGGFADVFCADLDGIPVALKRLRVSLKDAEGSVFQGKICKESLIWRNQQHPNILPFWGIDRETFSDTGFLCMVSPWMRRGTVMDVIRSEKPETVIREKMLGDIVAGIGYLHSQDIIHGDIRGSNVFVDEDGHAVLADFGLAVISDASVGMGSTSGEGGSTRWMPPELLDPERFGLMKFKRTKHADMYSFGCICLEVFSERHPFFDIKNDPTVILRVTEGWRPTIPSGTIISEDWLSIMHRCWDYYAWLRPSIHDVQASPLSPSH